MNAAPAQDRLLAKLVPQPNGCLHWTGVIDKQGYGRVGYRGRRGVLLHRAVHEEFVGPIPDGMTVDHTCHTDDPTCVGGSECLHRRCGNRDHFQIVTSVQNTQRGRSFSSVNRQKTHCRQGHEYTPENTYRSAGRRYCIECYAAAHDGHPPVRRAS